MSKKRVMAKSKIYGFNPWVDQVNAIDQIMEDTGERNESAVLRKLLDEALDARRKKGQATPRTEESDDAGVRLEKIESLLMRLVRQGDVRFVSRTCVWRFYSTFLLNLLQLAGCYGNRWSCLNCATRGFR